MREHYRAKHLCTAAAMTFRRSSLFLLSVLAAWAAPAMQGRSDWASAQAALPPDIAQLLPASGAIAPAPAEDLSVLSDAAIPLEGSAIAQLPPSLPPNLDPDLSPGPPEEPLPAEPLEPEPLPQLPPVDDLLESPDAPPSPSDGETFTISAIELAGSTVFSTEDFADLFAQYIGRPISFNDLLQLRSAVTQRYVDAGYVTSGAFIPPQTLSGGVVTVQVIEGEIEEIEIVGTRRLNPSYIRSRLGLAAQPPINTNRLLEGLQRLQVDPLIGTISADLQAGVQPGQSVLRVEVSEADSLDLTVGLDNGRSPNIGSIRRRVQISEGNLSGLGDRAYLSYANTNGSNSLDFSYSIPVSPHNTRVELAAGLSESRVIDDTFDVLDISANAHYYELGITHPLIETPTQDLFLGLTLSHKENQTRLGIDDIGPFPLSPGADANGETRVTTLQFSQGWNQRSRRQVLAARSQFNLGLNLLNATENEGDLPDSQFFSWRGQGQWVRLLGKDSLFFLRGDVQLATSSLLSSEQFGLGGQQTVRGYRQDALLRDNGALLSAEARFPIVRFAEESVVQITPFLEAGAAWNHQGPSSGNNVLVGTGVGLLWEQGDNFSARVDWGIPLVDIDSTSNSLQDNGIYFSVQYNLL
jgi:hemolysin activation/secretion protein